MSDVSGATVDATATAGIDANSAVEEAVSVSGATDVMAAIAGLNNPDSAFYTSIKGSDFATRKTVAAALTSSIPVDEHIGETLALRNVIILPVELANSEGVVNTAPRVIMITDSGTAYHATSIGLLSAIRNLFATLGEPETWPESVNVKVVQEKGNNGYKFFTLNLV